ncbi:MAG: potassium-transporting ATPase subunit KdpA, partial [Methylococcus sp.]|nr:potassium-transporting ATPase subunit KdpA [Methylococcus sp.]
MTANGLLQIFVYVGVLLALAKPLGSYMAAVYEGRSAAARWLAPIERLIYRIAGVDPQAEMRWTGYAAAFLLFNLLGALAVFALQRFQAVLPLNPQALAGVSPDSAFNTAVSFASNTNWQGYGGETTMSYLTQMLGLTVQNFVSAASGMAVLVALIRGFVRKNADTIGNFWVDMSRSTLYILLPLSFILALLLIGQGVVQTFGPYQSVPLMEATGYDKPKQDD